MKTKLLIITLSIFLSVGTSASVAKNFHFLEVQTVTAEQDAPAKDFTISPNPSSSKLNLRLPSIDEKTTLTVLDVLGKKIYSKELDQLITNVDVSRWNNGVYLVRITTEKTTQTKRFVKQ
ncbi:Por secretion system C-terminal sorting domain-containing protein [Flavobacteriaceae bacterium MAR_2010_188]|nr:Por secretion system C-terminal sorting domain-containing protein [Flavobacteriaceae bacterium MAR_2010_188]